MGQCEKKEKKWEKKANHVVVELDAGLAKAIAELATGEPPEGQDFEHHRQQVIHGETLRQKGLVVLVEVAVEDYNGQPIQSLDHRGPQSPLRLPHRPQPTRPAMLHPPLETKRSAKNKN